MSSDRRAGSTPAWGTQNKSTVYEADLLFIHSAFCYGILMLKNGERNTVQMETKNSFERIYDVVRQIPRGKVASYGQVAALAGNRRWSRVVGYALHVNPDEEGIPCYRVVTKDGRVSRAFAFGGGNRQIELLQADGIEFIDGHVDMKRFQWDTPWV